MGAFVHDCKSQWIQMLNELEPLQPDVTNGFNHNALKTAVMYPNTFERFWLTTPPKMALVQANSIDWDKVASELFEGKFSPAFIRHRYIDMARPLFRSSWSSKRKQRLEDYMASLGYTLNINSPQHSQEEPDWCQIAEFVSGGTFTPLAHRTFWRSLLHKKQIAGREWTQDQVLQYWKTWLKVGKNWRQIADSLSNTATGSQDVPPPTAAECRKAYQEISLRIARERPDLYEEASAANLATGVVNRCPTDDDWTDEMHQELLRVVKEEQEAYRKKYPDTPQAKVRSWETVAKRLNQPGLTASRCLNRYVRTHRHTTYVPENTARQRWMKEDMAQLLDAVNKRHPAWHEHWKQLRDDVFPNRSTYTLRRMWSDHAIQDLSKSRVLMSRLEKAVLDHGEHGWKLISEDMSKDGAAFKSMHVCREVWQTQMVDKSDPSWTDEETVQLQEQVKQVTENQRRAKEREVLQAPDWIRIGKKFPAKTSVQCMEKWAELKILQQQEMIREKMRKMDPAFKFIPTTINVEKVAGELWMDDKVLFDRNSDTTTTAPAETAKRAGEKTTVTVRGSAPLSLTPEELDKVWKQYRWTPERTMVLKRMVDKYGRHPAVLAQVAERLGAPRIGSAGTYTRLVQPSKRNRLATSDEAAESPSLGTLKDRFLWSKEYDQFLANRMALVGVKYKYRLEAYVDVANVFGIKPTNVSGRWKRILKRVEEENKKQ
ncbi:hypothetical protein BG006_006944 [Podila minutissima]|uniref:Myb-like domain-containing protein n=1 Tax=Podila minutissima TaxID=64525 RepID=A0A9P5SHZ1_9FUNG|nr:hypothetical protein BG006_006944 [Podila minutissima]